MFVVLTYTINAPDPDRARINDRLASCLKDYLKIDPAGLGTFYLVGLNYRSDWDDLCDCMETICKDFPALFDFYLSPIIPNGRRSCFVFNKLSTDDLNMLMDIID